MRTKSANWSQKVLSIGIPLSLIVGCSSEPSAQEKRNNFDACVIEYKAQNPGRVMIDPVKDVELRQMRAESACAYHLK